MRLREVNCNIQQGPGEVFSEECIPKLSGWLSRLASAGDTLPHCRPGRKTFSRALENVLISHIDVHSRSDSRLSTDGLCWATLRRRYRPLVNRLHLPPRRAASRGGRHRRSISAASMQRMLCVRAIDVLLLRYVGDPARDDVDERDE